MRELLKRLLPKKIVRIIQNRNLDLEKYIVLSKEDLTYSNDLLYTMHNADFMAEEKFAEAYRMCKEIGGKLLENYDIQWRVHVLCWAASHGAKLQGDFIDCGVYSGFCTRAVIHYSDFQHLDKTYYLMDTFNGMDSRYSSEFEMQRDAKLGYKEVDRYPEVVERFKDYNVQVIKGPIPDTLPRNAAERVAFLSIDMNCVIPEVAALEYFWPKMTSGAMIVLDDYGYPGCTDQKRAHDRFASSKGVKVLSLPTCQGLIVKP